MKIKWVKDARWWELRIYPNPKRRPRSGFMMGEVDKRDDGFVAWWHAEDGRDGWIDVFPTLKAAKLAVVDWWGLTL